MREKKILSLYRGVLFYNLFVCVNFFQHNMHHHPSVANPISALLLVTLFHG